MLARQKKLIQDTWTQVVPIADQAAAIFYQRLFEIDPSTRTLFNTTDMVQQHKKLVQILSVAVSSLDNLGALGKTVEDLGRRYALPAPEFFVGLAEDGVSRARPASWRTRRAIG